MISNYQFLMYLRIVLLKNSYYHNLKLLILYLFGIVLLKNHQNLKLWFLSVCLRLFYWSIITISNYWFLICLDCPIQELSQSQTIHFSLSGMVLMKHNHNLELSILYLSKTVLKRHYHNLKLLNFNEYGIVLLGNYHILNP
jgi:hypothetical protein